MNWNTAVGNHLFEGLRNTNTMQNICSFAILLVNLFFTFCTNFTDCFDEPVLDADKIVIFTEPLGKLKLSFTAIFQDQLLKPLQLYRFFTTNFIHHDEDHLAVNAPMILFSIFAVEAEFGPLVLILLYLSCGMLGWCCSMLAIRFRAARKDRSYLFEHSLCGASPSIYAMVALLLTVQPTTPLPPLARWGGLVGILIVIVPELRAYCLVRLQKTTTSTSDAFRAGQRNLVVSLCLNVSVFLCMAWLGTHVCALHYAVYHMLWRFFSFWKHRFTVVDDEAAHAGGVLVCLAWVWVFYHTSADSAATHAISSNGAVTAITQFVYFSNIIIGCLMYLRS